MKYFKLVVILVLFAGLLATTAFAGLAKGVASSNPVTAKQGTSVQRPLKIESDLEGRPAKAGPHRTFDMTKATPTPSQVEATLSPKVKQTYSGGLSGIYHIPGDFTSIGAAVAVANFVGLAANATFELDATSYSEPCPMTFGPYAGNTTFTLTVKPGPGVAAVVNLVSSTFQGKGFAFNGADNITIDGLNTGGSSLAIQYAPGATFPDSDGFGATIYITGASKNIAVKNTSIQGIVNDPVWANQTQGRPGVFIWAADADAAANSGITFDGCTITNTTYAIKGLSETGVNPTVDGLVLNNNHIGGAYGNPAVQGVWVFWSANLTVSNNIIDGVEFLDNYWNNAYTEFDADQAFFGSTALMFTFGYTSAMYLAGTDGPLVHDNIIRNVSVSGPGGEGLSTYAVRVYDYPVTAGNPGLVYNNRIYDISNPGASLLVGFRGTTAKFYHNSIRLTGPANGATATCYNGGGGVAENNAFSNEMTGGTAATRRAFATGGTVDYNATFSSGNVSSAGNVVATAAAGADVHGVNGPVNFNADLHITSGPSSAENIGAPHILAANDIDGDARDTTIAGTRDAGADQFPNTGTPQAIDILPYVITSPLPGGVPAGLPVPVTVSVKNNSNQVVTGAMLSAAITDGSTFGPSALPNIPSNGAITFTFVAQWTPPAGAWTISATTSGVVDADPSNDTYSRAQGVSAAVVPAPDTTYHWDASANGWVGTNDWGTAPRTFTKLSGVYGGSGKSWVTNCPLDPGTYTEGQTANLEGYAAAYPGPNLLTSPWFNLSAMTTDVYVSDLQSIGCEPGWDGSWWEYTTDGVHWKHLGHANDINGINWYNTSVYQNSPSFTGNPPDSVTMKMSQYDLYGTPDDNTIFPMGWWTSNGYPGLPNQPAETGQVTGPFGYVFQQLHITAANYPDIVGAPLVKFRLVAFSDAVNPPSVPPYVDTAAARALGIVGWAVDNFRVGPTGAQFSGGSISGTVFRDLNNNGINDDATPEVGVTVNLLYFGVQSASTVTDPSGNYSFDNTKVTLPGTYSIEVVHAGFAFTTPNPIVVADPADGSPASIITGLQTGDYQGSISGTKWNDINHNGVKDNGEPGLAGWTINLRKDSCTGAIVQTTVTDSLGNYSFVVLPGTYYVTELQQQFWNETFPPNNCTPITTTTPSGSQNAVITGINFGNWNTGTFTIHKYIDINGNGVDDGGADHTALPNGVIGVITITKDGNPFAVDTMGNGVSSLVHANLALGTYVATETFATNPWYNTLTTGATFVVNASGSAQTAEFLNFKAFTITGTKYEDLNGNGVKDAGEPGVSGVTVNIDGLMAPGGTPSAVTDSNGNWSITKVGGAVHHINETVPAGWLKTAPVADSVSANYVVLWTGTGTGVYTAKPIGDFKTVCISGVKYRDRNHDGQREAGEEGLDSVKINVSGNGGSFAYTDVNGNYQICGLGPGSHTVTETPVVGFVQTQPAPAGYTFTASSHTNVAGLDFGNFKTSDSSYLYRSFSSDDIEKAAQEKVVKPPKTGKPMGANTPNLNNVVTDYFSKTQQGVVQVGLSGVNNALGKPKAYIYITKAADFLKSLWDKGATHSAVADSLDVFRGLDFTDKLKPLVGKQKSFSPKLQRNDLAEELMVLAFNLGLELKLKIPAGFGNLVYNDGLVEPTECVQYGFPLNGKTIAQIKAIGDNIMTNSDFVPLSCYKRLEAVASNINQAFSCGGVDCEVAVEPILVDSTLFKTGGKVSWRGIYPVTVASYLKSNSGIAPVTPPLWQEQAIPKTYALYQNYPNPFNPTTTIQFDLPEAANVTVKIYNILGQEVATLLDHQSFDAGNQSVDFDASRYASGVYLYRLVAERTSDNGISTGLSFTQVKKMVLLK